MADEKKSEDKKAEDKKVDLSIPDEVRIKRPDPAEGKLSQGAKVTGDQSIMVIDVLQNKPVQIFLIKAQCFAPEQAPEDAEEEGEDFLVFIQGTVSNELLPAANAKSRFAVKKDGTVIYNARGFDDVPANADFDMVDIVKLVEWNHDEGFSKREEARKEEAAADKKVLDEDRKRADEKKKADEDAARAAEKAERGTPATATSKR